MFLEIVKFNLQSGISDEQFLEKSAAVQTWLEGMPGYAGRSLARGQDGSWVDLVQWHSLEEAETAASQIMSTPVGQAFGGMINPESIDMNHMEIKFTA